MYLSCLSSLLVMPYHISWISVVTVVTTSLWLGSWIARWQLRQDSLLDNLFSILACVNCSKEGELNDEGKYPGGLADRDSWFFHRRLRVSRFDYHSLGMLWSIVNSSPKSRKPSCRFRVGLQFNLSFISMICSRLLTSSPTTPRRCKI